MTTTNNPTAVHFGAGVIGRGFIADLLHDSGYDIVFVDLNTAMVELINHAGSYRLWSLQDEGSSKAIDRVSALGLPADHDRVVEALSNASVITTSVWADNLPGIAGVIGEGLARRLDRGGEPVNVIACENAVGASNRLRDAILEAPGSHWTPESLASVAGFVNCSVHRMVFRPLDADSLDVRVSDAFELALARDQLVDPEREPIAGATYSDDIAAHVERKLHIINCGHAIAGYLAAYRGWGDPRESFVREEGLRLVEGAMRESAATVAAKHGFGPEEMEAYVRATVELFQTPSAHYRIQDVARSPIRKLAPSDRLVGPVTYCETHGLPNTHLVDGIALALLYDDPDDAQSVELQRLITDQGLPGALAEVSGIPAGSELSEKIRRPSWTSLVP